jgi:hypothetical protein
MLIISACQRNCNQPDSKRKFSIKTTKKKGYSALKINPTKSLNNTTFANTDNKVNKLVTFFAICFYSPDRLVITQTAITQVLSK